TIHSSRRRFAARLNSGVRGHMKDISQFKFAKARSSVAVAVVLIMAAFLAAKGLTAEPNATRSLLAAFGLALCAPYAYFRPHLTVFGQHDPDPSPAWSKMLVVVGIAIVVAAFVVPLL